MQFDTLCSDRRQLIWVDQSAPECVPLHKCTLHLQGFLNRRDSTFRRGQGRRGELLLLAKVVFQTFCFVGWLDLTGVLRLRRCDSIYQAWRITDFGAIRCVVNGNFTLVIQTGATASGWQIGCFRDQV